MTSKHIMMCLCAGKLLAVSQVSTDAEDVTTLAMATACGIASHDCSKGCHDNNGVEPTGL